MSKKQYNTLLPKILTVHNKAVEKIYRMIDEMAEKHDLTYEQVMSILANYRHDIHTKALKQILFTFRRGGIKMKFRKKLIKFAKIDNGMLFVGTVMVILLLIFYVGFGILLGSQLVINIFIMAGAMAFADMIRRRIIK